MEGALKSEPRSTMADSVFVQGIRKALSAPELIQRITNAASLKRKILETLKAKIEEREKSDQYSIESCEEMIKPYGFTCPPNSRQWIEDLFEEDSVTSESSDDEITETRYRQMLKNHIKKKSCANNLSTDPYYSKFQHYSSDYVNNEHKWIYHKKGFKRMRKKKQKANSRITKDSSNGATLLSTNTPGTAVELDDKNGLSTNVATSQSKKKKSVNMDAIRRKHWKLIAKKDIPKAFRTRLQVRTGQLSTLRRVSREVMKKQRGNAAVSVKISKEKNGRARRITREMQLFWKKYSKVEKVHRKKAEKHALEQIRLDEELREAKRQQRKLNFLISQTELFAHFMSKKLAKQQNIEYDDITKDIMKGIEKDYDDDSNTSTFDSTLDEVTTGSYYSRKAVDNVNQAMDRQRSQTAAFNPEQDVAVDWEGSEDKEITQPSLFKGILKSYQLKGVNWLVNLYQQGINGILADEMGLGKTVQTIAFFGHLAQRLNIWGPFLVVAPASTLNNWHQEFTKFFPDFKVLPYWGNPADRKVLRTFWNLKASYHSDRDSAPFHILITSYQLVISDVRYFQRIKWQYMVLDEAQALKSTASVRWKILLEFNCRNRLLLTGTPIQNTMAELWALLHFIMPSLFDSHNEFNEWFSKDIENHIENKSDIDETQLSRLHMILKPFMLRRIKRDVENELSDKIEIRVHCGLAPRQKSLYDAIKRNIKLEDLLKSTGNLFVNAGSGHTLMNLVMQFRKVCNHPDLFERREVESPFHCGPLSPFRLPKLLYKEGILSRVTPGKRKMLYCDLNVHHPLNVSRSYPNEFSFLRLLDLSVGDYWKSFTEPANYHSSYLSRSERNVKLQSYFHKIFYSDIVMDAKSRNDSLLVADLSSYGKFNVSSPYAELIFTNGCSPASFDTIQLELFPKNIFRLFNRVVTSSAHTVYCCDRNFCNEMASLSDNVTPEENHNPTIYPVGGWSNIHIPSKEYLVTDSGKLYALDVLLRKLHMGGHRVLIYSQMTKMIDILEEYMLYRDYTYIRLDGSSRISERRDMVADFQTRSDIFAFLLSTRAGGLGINLTAADTVIFYDSDWNPTVDQQAMDRAHRLGQTKQVTVYRLVCEGTVDERILQRAEEKNVIQRMVIAGGSFKPDILKTKEVVSLLLDDEQLIQRLKMRREENKGEVLPYRGKKRGRKSNAEREAKRLKQLQEQAVSGTVSDASSGNFTITHESNSSVEPDIFETKFLTAASSHDWDSESVLDSAPASPSSQVSGNSESKNAESHTIVVDDTSPGSHTSPSTVYSRARGAGRGRGRPRIRPIVQDTQRPRGRPATIRGTPSKRRASRVKRIFTGRAAAMAGARAGAAAASAATFATYGYGLEPTDLSTTPEKDKTISNVPSVS